MKKNLPIYGVNEESLGKYVTNKKEASKGTNKKPEHTFRIKEEDDYPE